MQNTKTAFLLQIELNKKNFALVLWGRKAWGLRKISVMEVLPSTAVVADKELVLCLRLYLWSPSVLKFRK